MSFPGPRLRRRLVLPPQVTRRQAKSNGRTFAHLGVVLTPGRPPPEWGGVARPPEPRRARRPAPRRLRGRGGRAGGVPRPVVLRPPGAARRARGVPRGPGGRVQGRRRAVRPRLHRVRGGGVPG